VDVVVNGVLQEQANGAEVLGTPVESVQWLANKFAGFDQKLEAVEQRFFNCTGCKTCQ